MRKSFNILIIIISIVLLEYVNADSKSITYYKPYDTNFVTALYPTNIIANKNGGYLLIGSAFRKQLTEFGDYPEGTFLLNLIPDNTYIYDYHKENGFYKEAFLDNKPLNTSKNSTLAYFKDNNNIVVANAWNWYYTPGIGGSAGFMMPFLVEFESDGKFARKNVDSITDKKHTQPWGSFPPILLNENKSFYFFNASAPDSLIYLFASHYDINANLIERIPIIEMSKDTCGQTEGISAYGYFANQALRAANGDIYLNCTLVRYRGGSEGEKRSALVMKVDNDFNIVWQKEFILNDLDHANRKVSSGCDEILFNSDGDLVVIGRHFLQPTDMEAGFDNYFVYFLDSNNGKVKYSRTWKDSVLIFSHIIQTSDKGYLAVGKERNLFYSGNYYDGNEYNYAAVKFDESFDNPKFFFNPDKKSFDDILTVAVESSENIYDCFGKFDDRIFLVRLQNNDFITGIDNEVFNKNLLELKTHFSNYNIIARFNIIEPCYSEICIYDLMGKLVYSSGFNYYTIGRNEVIINASYLPTGCYVIALKTPWKSVTNKVIITE